MIEKINDYKQYNQPPYLIQFFSDSNFKNILEVNDTQANELETATFDMLSNMFLESAVGMQLDILGKHLDLLRYGRDDDSYRTLLKSKAAINVSSGTPEQVIEAIKTLYSATNVQMSFNYPAKIEIAQNGSLQLFVTFDALFENFDNVIFENGDFALFQQFDATAESIKDFIVPAGVKITITSL